MSIEREFVPRPIESPGISAYALRELEADISLLSEHGREVVGKHLRGEPLNPTEQELFNEERGRWWQDKYGFPFHKKAERREVLTRKYGPRQEHIEANALQDKLFAAFQKRDRAALAQLKIEYETRYPDQLEGVEVLFGLPDYFKSQELLAKIPHSTPEQFEQEVAPAIEDCTEFHFLVTHFLLSNSNDKEFLSRFWTTLEDLAKASGDLKQTQIMRRGVVTQVAVQKVFEALGEHPQLSHPQEDAFRAVDLWADTDHAVQVKGTSHAKDGGIWSTDEMALPAVRIRDQDGSERHYSSHYTAEANRFRLKISRYGKQIGRNLKGYFIVVPYQKIDFVTGEPDPGFVEEVREALKAQKETTDASDI
ncbi:MAG: hypothetical protein Q8Q39_01445 [bacterium]|nr:hypothetical protein [bacterium]